MTSAPSSSSNNSDGGVDLVDLRFAYGGSASNGPLLLDGFTLSLPPGARCLLVGANGAGEIFSFFFFFLAFFFSLPRQARVARSQAERERNNNKKNTFRQNHAPAGRRRTPHGPALRRLRPRPSRLPRHLPGRLRGPLLPGSGVEEGRGLRGVRRAAAGRPRRGRDPVPRAGGRPAEARTFNLSARHRPELEAAAPLGRPAPARAGGHGPPQTFQGPLAGRSDGRHGCFGEVGSLGLSRGRVRDQGGGGGVRDAHLRRAAGVGDAPGARQ